MELAELVPEIPSLTVALSSSWEQPEMSCLNQASTMPIQCKSCSNLTADQREHKELCERLSLPLLDTAEEIDKDISHSVKQQ